MIAFVKEKNKNNQDKWSYCHHFSIFPLLGVNHCLPLFHISMKFVYIHNIEENINEFSIGYMVKTTFRVNKTFKEQVERCMNDTIGTIKKPFI